MKQRLTWKCRCRWREASRRGERGATLVSGLVALAIAAGALSLLLGALGPSSSSAAIVRRRVTAGNYARKQLEAIEAAAYQANPTAVPYPTVSLAAHYAISVTVSHWVSATSTFTDTVPAEDAGLQRVRVKVFTAGNPESVAAELESFKLALP